MCTSPSLSYFWPIVAFPENLNRFRAPIHSHAKLWIGGEIFSPTILRAEKSAPLRPGLNNYGESLTGDHYKDSFVMMPEKPLLPWLYHYSPKLLQGGKNIHQYTSSPSFWVEERFPTPIVPGGEVENRSVPHKSFSEFSLAVFPSKWVI